jgi:hypothetical protein
MPQTRGFQGALFERVRKRFDLSGDLERAVAAFEEQLIAATISRIYCT